MTSFGSFSMGEQGASFGAATVLTFALPPVPILVKTIIRPYRKSAEGTLIKSVAVPWKLIARLLEKDPRLAYQISPEKWEEMVAAAFDQDGYDEVTLTPRSGE